MSYDLAVWEGERPADDTSAAAVFEALYDRYVESGAHHPPTARITEYAAALAARWRSRGEDAEDDTSLLEEASGPLLYFPMSWSAGEQTYAAAAALAHAHGLVCFDPQLERLRP